MKVPAIRVCLAFLLMPLACAAAGEPLMQNLQFPMESYKGHFRERCLALDASQTLDLTVRSEYPIRLNLHHHLRSGTTFLLDKIVESERNTVSIPADGEYCLEVSNPDNRPAAFEVHMELRLSPA